MGSFRVRLIDSLKSVDEIPRTGQKQIILAKVGQVIHLRVFDDDGSMVVDADTDLLPEKPFSLKLGEPGNRLLKDKLKGFWPPHELNESERTKVIAAVESIFDIWEVRLWKNGTDPYKKVYEIMSKTPADSEPVDNEVRGLLRKRRDSKMRYLFTKGGFYEESRLNFEGLTADVISALRTQLDWLEDPADQVMIYELLLEFAGDLERTKAAEIEVGRATVADLEQARTQRINCEIDLLRAKRKLPKK